MLIPLLSGRQDSNLRPPGPKPGAMTGLRYAPNLVTFCYCYQFDRYQTRLTIINLRGGSEITSALLQCSTLRSGSNEFKSPFTSHHNQSSRWERDSNSRYSYPYDSLANCWFQPLTHPTYALTDGKSKKSFCFFRILDEKKWLNRKQILHSLI